MALGDHSPEDKESVHRVRVEVQGGGNAKVCAARLARRRRTIGIW